MPKKIEEREPSKQQEDPKSPEEFIIFSDLIHRVKNAVDKVLDQQDEVETSPPENFPKSKRKKKKTI